MKEKRSHYLFMRSLYIPKLSSKVGNQVTQTPNQPQRLPVEYLFESLTVASPRNQNSRILFVILRLREILFKTGEL